ncbi:hypothetical protein HA402_010584 [Bradysia odoriphaga]|nr:hypothetical protein HA402_010584 [Bradysia odoriphaga]
MCLSTVYIQSIFIPFPFEGIDHASEIADMVANTFSNKSKQHKYQNRQDDPGDYNNHNTLMISNILQLIGLDSAKIGALAVNGIIFIAQVVRNGITVVKSYVHQSLLDWGMIGEFIIHRLHEGLKPNSTSVSIMSPS